MPRRYDSAALAKLSKEGLSAQLPAPKQRKVQANDEWKIERAVYVWWLANCASFGIDPRLYFSVPNGSALGFGKEDYQKKGSAIRGRLMKLIGLQPGIPDKMLAVRSRTFAGLFLEFKTPVGVVSQEQSEMHALLASMGYYCKVCRSAEEGIAAIKGYLA